MRKNIQVIVMITVTVILLASMLYLHFSSVGILRDCLTDSQGKLAARVKWQEGLYQTLQRNQGATVRFEEKIDKTSGKMGRRILLYGKDEIVVIYENF